jgi:hypothetical protein
MATFFKSEGAEMKILLLLLLLCLLISCRMKASERNVPEKTEQVESVVVIQDSSAIIDSVPKDTARKGIDTLSSVLQPDTNIQDKLLSVTVRDLLESHEFVGKTVQVEGKCLGYGKIVAQGGPPLTRSDWQLEDDGVAIYVSGPLPAGCSATEGSTVRKVIVAYVAEDTLRGLGGQSNTARRYLVSLNK